MKPHRFSKTATHAIREFRRLPEEDPPRMQRREVREVGDLISELRGKFGIGQALPEDAIRESWASLVGAANAAYSHAVRIDGKRLIVQVSHSVVRNELFLHRSQILDRIKKVPGCGGVADLRFVSG